MNERLTGLIQEKWMALVAWIGMLLALIFTSYQPVGLVRGSGISQLVMAVLGQPGILSQNQGLIIPFVGLVLMVIAFVLLLFVWLRFAQLTNDVMISLSTGPDETEPVFLSFLDLAKTSAGEAGTEYEAKGSTFGEIVRLLAMVWVLVLFATALFSIGGVA